MGWLDGHSPGKRFVGCAQTFVSWMCRNTPVSTAQLAYEKQLDTLNLQPTYVGYQNHQSAIVGMWGLPMNVGVIPLPTTPLGFAQHGYDGAYASAPIDVGNVVRRMAADALNNGGV